MSTIKNCKLAILDAIKNNYGIEAMSLVCRPEVAPYCAEINLIDLLADMIDEKEIIGLRFEANNQIKTIYFPKGTKFFWE
jgi:hypothetical protein